MKARDVSMPDMNDCFYLMQYHTDGAPAISHHPLSKRKGCLLDIEWNDRHKKSQKQKKKLRLPISPFYTVIGINEARRIFTEFKRTEDIIKQNKSKLREIFNKMEALSIANLSKRKEKSLDKWMKR